jgi:chemotaxis protein CheY-P-specific phosphatase CheC
MDILTREKLLLQMMHAGFDKAAASFARFTRKPVKILSAESRMIHQSDDLAHLCEEQGELLILITQIIGDISGKSYLIFSSEEIHEVLKAINLSSTDERLNEAFLMEIDNIISASVISEISNVLSLRIYGDVPRVVRCNSNNLFEFLTGELNSIESTSIILSNSVFQFDNKENVHPQFIWKLSSKIFELIPEEKTPA